MLYRITGEEIATRRHVEVSGWEAPDIETAARRAVEVGIVVSTIEPVDGTVESMEQCGEPCRAGGIDHVETNGILDVTGTPTEDSISRGKNIAFGAVMLAMFVFFILYTVSRGNSNSQREHYDIVRTQLDTSYPTSDVHTHGSSLPEWKRRKIFFDLVAAQDAGVGDSEAFFLVATRYGLPKATIDRIAVEGVVKKWPMPWPQ